jgi:hypothetical protein
MDKNKKIDVAQKLAPKVMNLIMKLVRFRAGGYSIRERKIIAEDLIELAGIILEELKDEDI